MGPLWFVKTVRAQLKRSCLPKNPRVSACLLVCWMMGGDPRPANRMRAQVESAVEVERNRDKPEWSIYAAHEDRTHLELAKDTPTGRPVAIRSAIGTRIQSFSRLLH